MQNNLINQPGVLELLKKLMLEGSELAQKGPESMTFQRMSEAGDEQTIVYGGEGKPVLLYLAQNANPISYASAREAAMEIRQELNPPAVDFGNLFEKEDDMMDHGEMAQRYYPALSPEEEEEEKTLAQKAYDNFISAKLTYEADNVQYDAELRYEAAVEADKAALAADKYFDPKSPEGIEIGNFLNDLYASRDLD